MISKAAGACFNQFSEMKVSMADDHSKRNEEVAWASGLKQAQLKARNGTTITPINLASSAFQKQADAWNIVSHRASGMPQ